MLLQFIFEFYNHATYHGLVNPGNPIVQAVLSTMIDAEDYYFFAINPDQTILAFRSQLETADLAGLKTNQARFKEFRCTSEQYDRALKQFSKHPDPPGKVMAWVCRENPDYLDLTQHRLELSPRP